MSEADARAVGLGTRREALLGRTFVELADTLVEGFQVVDFLHTLCERCIEVLEVDAVGVLLANTRRELELSAASSEDAELTELLELQKQEGPCYEAFVSGVSVGHSDLATAEERWPRFVPRALKSGFRSVYGFPLRLREDVIGALNMFRFDAWVFESEDVLAGRAMADIAAIGIMQERVVSEARLHAEQLQHALASRAAIEQAKGILAERCGLSPGEAFVLLRDHARDTRRPISEVSTDIIDGRLSIG